MVRVVMLSLEVFTAIWALRQEGDTSEDDILARVLNVAPPPDVEANPVAAGQEVHVLGNWDGFPDGFEVYRLHKGKTYTARAEGIYWRRLDNGRTYRTLNSLNNSIIGRNQSVWSGSWLYRAPDGNGRSIAELRRY